MLKVLFGRDRTFGAFLLSLGLLASVYYTFWIILLPLLPFEEEHVVRRLFPKNSTLGLALPVVLGTAFCAGIALFAFVEMRRSREHYDNLKPHS